MSIDAAPRKVDVSVVLLTYNHERFIEQAIESVRAQRGITFELLIVEDCSTDRTRAIARRYEQRCPELVRLFLSPTNQNSNRVLAAPLAAAQGRYVATLDGDDFWISSQKLRQQVEYLDATPSCALCFHQVQLVGVDGRPVNGATGAVAVETIDAHEVVRTYTIADMLEHNLIPGCSPLIRREALADLPAWFYEAEYGDWPMYLHVLRSGTADRIPGVLGAYRIHGDGYWNGQRRRQQLESRLRLNALLRVHVGAAHEARLHEIATLLSARLISVSLSEGDAAAAFRHAMVVVRTIANAPREYLAGGRWRRLVYAMRSRRQGTAQQSMR